MKVIAFVPFYEPGFKGGGPIRSVKNISNLIGHLCDFNVVTSDRDLGDRQSYPGIAKDELKLTENGTVYYCGRSIVSFFKLIFMIFRCPAEAYYFNSLFSVSFSIVPLLLVKIIHPNGNYRLVLAPRGELNDGALRIKSFKKKLFIILCKIFRLLNGVVWHVTSNEERSAVISIFNCSSDKVLLVQNVVVVPSYDNVSHEFDSSLKLCFLSRISRKKNLDYALRVLAKCSGNIVFDIYGPIEDPVYWSECVSLIAKLPDNIMVNYLGALNNSIVGSTLCRYHLFFLPTRSENFGHVISESLSVGTTVLISDQTPFNDLEEYNAGWALSLDDSDVFTNRIEFFCKLSGDDINLFKKNSMKYWSNKFMNKSSLPQYCNLFGISN